MVGDRICRLGYTRVDDQITRCQDGERRARLPDQPEGHVHVAERGAGCEHAAGMNQHAPIFKPDARIARAKEWGKPPRGGGCLAVDNRIAASTTYPIHPAATGELLPAQPWRTCTASRASAVLRACRNACGVL